MIEIVKATTEHARVIELRESDAREIAALGMTKHEALQMSLDRSLWADAYLVDGEVAALMGVILPSLLGGSPAAAWLMTGTPVDRCRKDFLRLTRARVREMLAQHGTLTCNVHAEYAGAIRWLRWLGFEIGPARPTGSLGALFHEATLRRHGPVVVRPSRVAEIETAANWPALAAEYADETLIAGMPPPLARWPAYHALEAAGLLSVFAAWDDGTLAGFLSVLAADLPRYGRRVAMSESFFVARSYRKTGAGLKLLRAAEDKARAMDSPGLFVTAPFEGDLFKVLPRVGYGEAARVFFKRTLSGQEPGNRGLPHE